MSEFKETRFSREIVSQLGHDHIDPNQLKGTPERKRYALVNKVSSDR